MTAGSPTLWMLALALALTSPPARAQDDSIPETEFELPEPQTDTFTGAMQHSVPLEVPDFRGLVPALALSYSSQSSHGLAGPGWELSGISSVYRTGPSGKGVPGYEDTDGYRFRGEKLLACQPGWASPSCTTGGSHATEKENYLRIQHVASIFPVEDKWYVWRRDGTKETYSTVHTSATGTYASWRWGLTEVRDTRGNTVAINWSTATGNGIAYPASVVYNGVTVTLYWETATPRYTRAAGTFLEYANKRLKSVDVKIGSSRLRAYKLTYAANANLNLYHLSSAQVFGSDASVDSSGAVSGGTSLPASIYGYPAGDSKLANYTPNTLSESDNTGPNHKVLSGDFNGDGRTDLVHFVSNSTCDGVACLDVKVWRSEVGKAGASNGFTVIRSTLPAGYDTYTASGKDNFRVGDFDADGVDDVLHHIASTTNSKFMIWFFNKDGQIRAGSPTSFDYPYDTSHGLKHAGDFNGDGRLDLAHKTGGALHILLSNGDGSFSYDWSKATSIAPPTGYVETATQAVDANGDGKTDLVYAFFNGSNATESPTRYVKVRTYASDGIGQFSSLSGELSLSIPGTGGNSSSIAGWTWGDFNGDGNAADFRYSRTYHYGDENEVWNVHFARGNGSYDGGRSWSRTSCSWPAYCGGAAIPSDLNADSIVDYVFFGSSCNTTSCTPRRWTYIGQPDGTYAQVQAVDGPSTAQFIQAGDFSGDGKTDIFYKTGNGAAAHVVLTANGPYRALLTSTTQSMGGTTNVAYTPSSEFSNTNGPPVTYAITSMTQSDGRGWSSTTRYSYAGGLYDSLEKRFLGFRYSSTSPPKLASEAESPCTETWYKQDYASISKPEEVKRWSGACGTSTLLSYVKNEYTTNPTAPFTTRLTGVWSYDYPPDGSGASRRTYSQFEYDAYNNTVLETYHGDYDVAGDEKRQVTGFAPNTSAFIVGLPSYSQTWSGLHGGTKLVETLRYYDGASSYSTPPTLGNLTKSEAWRDSPASYIASTSAFDGMGNIISAIDPLGAVTESVYDPAGLLLQTTNALGQVATISYDALRRATSSTDINSHVSTTQHDALGRILRVTDAAGHITETLYENLGDVTRQRILTKSSPADGVNWIVSARYLDGMGRTYREASACPAPYSCGAGSGSTYVDSTYNERGQLASQSLPYTEGNPSYVETRTYDALNRVARVTYADGSYVQSEQLLWGVRQTDEVGSQQEEYTDAYGNVIRHSEKLAGAWYHLDYRYDLLGHKTQVIDPLGNISTYTFDSLGRRLTASDPDLGTRTASYNAAGEVTSSTDAKGQVVEAVFDVLNRKVAVGVNRPASSTVTINARTSSGSGARMKLLVDAVERATWTVGNSSMDHAWSGKVVGSVDVQCTNCDASVQLTVNTVSVDASSQNGADFNVILEDATGVSASTGVLSSAGKLRFNFGEAALWYDQPGHGSGIGRRTGSIDRAGRRALTYDAAGRVIRQVDSRSPSAIYTSSQVYDVGGRVLGLKFPDGDVSGKDPDTGAGTPLGYDRAGRLISIPGILTGALYNASGKLIQLNNANGTVTTYIHQANRGWLSGIQTVKGATTLQSLSYARDSKGRISSISGSASLNQNWTYGYDELHRLTSATPNAPTTASAESYEYNPIGNLTRINGLALSYPASGPGSVRPHGVQGFNGNNYTYDANGNLLLGAGRSYTWDAFDRPVTINNISFVYTLEGERAANGAIHYVAGGYELDTSTGVSTKIFSVAGRPIAQKVGTTVSWLHTNHLASVQASTDGSGNLLAEQAYLPYGGQISGAIASPVSFTGERKDSTGLMYLHARYYDPELRRFISADPTIPSQNISGLNHYTYAANNPITYHDRSGFQEQSEVDERIDQIEAAYPFVDIQDTNWTLVELNEIELGLQWQAAAWEQATDDSAAFANAFSAEAVVIVHVDPATDPRFSDNPAYLTYRGWTEGSTVYLSTRDTVDHTTVIHEMGHVWDLRTPAEAWLLMTWMGKQPGNNLSTSFGATFDWTCEGLSNGSDCLSGARSTGSGQTTKYGQTSPREDFAESYTAAVYDANGAVYLGADGLSLAPDAYRISFVVNAMNWWTQGNSNFSLMP